MLAYLKANNVRVYGVIVSVLLLVAHYVPSLPVLLYAGVAAAVLGVGERINAKTVHSDFVAVDSRNLAPGEVPVMVNIPKAIEAVWGTPASDSVSAEDAS